MKRTIGIAVLGLAAALGTSGGIYHAIQGWHDQKAICNGDSSLKTQFSKEDNFIGASIDGFVGLVFGLLFTGEKVADRAVAKMKFTP